MQLQTAINKRKSIREYESKPVSKAIIKNLILSATKAPSAKNEQNYRFYAITSRKIRDLIVKKVVAKVNKSEFNTLEPKIKKIALKFYENLGNAPNFILVYREKKKNPKSYQFPNDLSSISAAIENLMLSAVEQGLGTCWVGTFKGVEKQINKLLKTPKDQELITGLLIGYPKKAYKPLIRKKKKLNEILKFK